ncbi:MAG: hypothetical protein HKN16_10150, partial [Saprospiraceae bacterium]|nr:hypothetical protein [Saprospiraceae bacterium]
MTELTSTDTAKSIASKEVSGRLIEEGNEKFYKISNFDQMRPFFMSILSAYDHWMFISSTGGLSAGRKNSSRSLFPYYSDDKISESYEVTGSKTIFQISSEGKQILWEPFSQRQAGTFSIERNLYKNTYGNKVRFEEINHDLGLTFSYEWNSSDRFGFVKRSSLKNHGLSPVKVNLLDGIQNILPYGVPSDLQNEMSNLVDAYKKNELEPGGLGIYSLSAIIVDKAEPSEALKANIAWSTGLSDPLHLLTSTQLDNFRRGENLRQEEDIRAERGAYFLSTEISLGAEEAKDWRIIANVNQSMAGVNEIKQLHNSGSDLTSIVQQDIDAGTDQLINLASASDGFQITKDKLRVARHYSNTMFNIMRGGIFDNNYQIEKEDFLKYLEKANKEVLKRNEVILGKLPVEFTQQILANLYSEANDKDLFRLCVEYLPLKFSRRHGDPSRPWNKFSINTRDEQDGSKILDYEGNWRDIFQNWEALAHSYPGFIEGMIHKFLNATTFEGYNPYRVTKGGFDWEIIEPDDPWSYIGYWGDHQIIYLLKFLEFSESYFPGQLEKHLDSPIFVYANVPYKIKGYQDLLRDPKDTIDFDHDLDLKINKWKNELGADGTLLKDKGSSIYKVNLLEKLLATTL